MDDGDGRWRSVFVVHDSSDVRRGEIGVRGRDAVRGGGVRAVVRGARPGRSSGRGIRGGEGGVRAGTFEDGSPEAYAEWMAAGQCPRECVWFVTEAQRAFLANALKSEGRRARRRGRGAHLGITRQGGV